MYFLEFPPFSCFYTTLSVPLSIFVESSLAIRSMSDVQNLLKYSSGDAIDLTRFYVRTCESPHTRRSSGDTLKTAVRPT